MSETRFRWCRHHEKPKPLEHACKAGVDMEAFGHRGALGGFYMLPCHSGEREGIKKCECTRRDFFTDAEVAQQDADDAAWLDETVKRLAKLAPFMTRVKAGRVTNGVDPCPCCEGGALSWRLCKTNNHVAARCSTEGCVAFME